VETAEKVLIVGAVLLLVYAFATGYIIGVVRGRRPDVPKYLTLAHTEPLMQGAMLLGLVWAVRLSDFAHGLETAAALLLVLAAAIQGAKELLNWSQGVNDEFAERPIGFWAARLQSTMASAGLLILLAGVISGL
jgi:hypothetical protein